MIERNESPKLRMRLAVETRTGLKTANVWGVLPGATDENIAVMAHTDAFFEGAMDNASGMATLVALAEHYAKVPKAQRRRTMTFFTTSAHHSPSGENAGIRWVHNNMKEMWSEDGAARQLRAHGAGRDLPGRRSVHHLQPGERAPLVRRRQRPAEEHRAEDVQGVRHCALLASRGASRAASWVSVFTDAPSFHIIDHTVYHTDMDTLSAVPAYGLEQSARAFAKIIDEVNKVEISALRGGPVTTTR